jgi:hypothetical protein
MDVPIVNWRFHNGSRGYNCKEYPPKDHWLQHRSLRSSFEGGVPKTPVEERTAWVGLVGRVFANDLSILSKKKIRQRTLQQGKVCLKLKGLLIGLVLHV